jgi:hypothetical protein
MYNVCTPLCFATLLHTCGAMLLLFVLLYYTLELFILRHGKVEFCPAFPAIVFSAYILAGMYDAYFNHLSVNIHYNVPLIEHEVLLHYYTPRSEPWYKVLIFV